MIGDFNFELMKKDIIAMIRKLYMKVRTCGPQTLLAGRWREIKDFRLTAARGREGEKRGEIDRERESKR